MIDEGMRDDAKFHEVTFAYRRGLGERILARVLKRVQDLEGWVLYNTREKDDRDLDAADDSDDEFFDDDLEDAGEDDIDLVVAVYREDGKATAVPLDYDLANDLEELIRQLGRLPGDSGADGFVSVAGEFFVICRVRGRIVEVLLSDVTAANDWPIARDVVDYLGEEIPDEDEESAPIGDLDMFAAAGLRGFELEAIATNYDEDSDELLMQVASRLKIADVFERAVEAFDE